MGMSFSEMQATAFQINEDHGFNKNYQVSEKLLLAVGEITEAVEELRNGHAPKEVYYKKDEQGNDKPEGFPVEIADAVIRLMSIAAMERIDLAQVIEEKLRYNQTRPFMHGRKF